jgi:hypothetical protein
MNLIITPTGKNSYFKKWIKDDCNFDIVLLCYEDIEEYKHTNIKFVKHFNAEKWSMSKRFITENLDFILQYDNFLFIDDDIDTDTESINKLFEIHSKYNLNLSQPSVSGYTSWKITNKVDGCLLRYTNYVEIMSPLMNKQTLMSLFQTFDLSQSGWGLDLLWTKMLDNDKIAIIDEVNVIHTRPVGKDYIINGSKRFKLNPKDELTMFMKKYNLSIDFKVLSQITSI